VSEVTIIANVNGSNNITGGGVDYDSGPYVVIFPAGETSVPFVVAINDDNIVEINETFNLTIVSSSSNKVTLGSSVQTTVTIFDRDCKHYYTSCIYTYYAVLCSICGKFQSAILQSQ